MKRWRFSRFWLVPLCALIAGGCINSETARRSVGEHYVSDNFYISPDPADIALRRVVLVPFFNESEYPDAADKVGDAFRIELEKLHRFEIISAGKYEKQLRDCNIFQEANLTARRFISRPRRSARRACSTAASSSTGPINPLSSASRPESSGLRRARWSGR